MLATERYNYELIEILIKAGANLQAIDTKGETAFHYAATQLSKRSYPRDNKTHWIRGLTHESAPKMFTVRVNLQLFHLPLVNSFLKLYNELITKHPEKNLGPIETIMIYLTMKGGFPKHIEPSSQDFYCDDFLRDEITKICQQEMISPVAIDHEKKLTIKRENQSGETESENPKSKKQKTEIANL